VDAFESLKFHLQKSCYSWKSRNQTNQDRICADASKSAFKFLFLFSIYQVWKGQGEVGNPRRETFLTVSAAHSHVCGMGNSLCFSETFFYMKQLIL